MLVAACGRIGFGSGESDAPTVEDVAADVAAVDAVPDAPALPRTVPIDTGPHHQGNDAGGTPNAPEGNLWTGGFELTAPCGGATLHMDFFPPWGPDPDSPPQFRVNGNLLGSVIPFFVNCQTSGCDSFPGGARIHAMLDASGAVILGHNVVRVDSSTQDDFFVGNIEMRCGS